MKLANKISNIIEGFQYTRIEDPAREELAKHRATICGPCENIEEGRIFGYNKKDKIIEIEGMKCGLCKCGLSEKLRAKGESCPVNKWHEDVS